MKSSFVVVLLTLMPAVLHAQQASDPLTVDPDVTIGRLSNGVTYYIRANKKPEARAELRLVVNAGSVLEDDRQRGLAHVAEHMAFNGTTHFEKQELVHYLESIGMRFGADLNAYTSFDETVYMLTVPTDTGKALEQGVQILEDWAHGVTFDAGEIAKERGVVIEEWRLGQGADERMRDKYFPVLFAKSRYAERLPIGTKTSLDTFKREDLVRFYREWYRPDLMGVIAVGDFDKTRVEQLIRSHFSNLTATQRTPRTLYPVPDHDSTLVAIATDKEATVASVSVYHKLPVTVQKTVGDYQEMLTEQLFLAMLNQRMDELTQQADPPFIGAGAGKGSLIRTKEAFMLSASTKDDGILRGLEAILTEGARVARFGFTAGEVERAKQNMLRGYERAYAEREKTESDAYASEYVNAYLEAEPMPGIATEFDLVKKLLPHITLEQLNGLARAWITDRNRVVVVEAPEKPTVKVPDTRAILDVFARVKTNQIAAYEDKVAGASLISNLPPAGRVTSEKRDSTTGITEWRLSNGVRVLLKPTDFRADQVLLRAYSPGGTSLVPDSNFISASAASLLVGLSGVGAFSATDLTKLLAGKVARVAPYIDERQEGFSGQASPRDLETLFQLVYLNATAPRRDSAAYQSLKTRLAALLENQSADPEAAFNDTVAVTLAQHHFRARPFTVQTLNEIDMERALAAYRERFADASDFTFVLVGSLTPDSVRPLVEKYLGALPATNRGDKWRDVGIRPPTGVVTRTLRKGIEPKSSTEIIFTGPFEYTAQNRTALNVLIDILEIRLRDRLREELSGTYGVDVSYSTAREPTPMYSISISFGADPARVDSLSNVVFSEIAAIKATDVKPDEMAKVKETQRREWETNMKRNEYWLGQISARDMMNERVADLMTFPQRLANVSAEDVRKAAQLLRPENYVRVTLLPER